MLVLVLLGAYSLWPRDPPKPFKLLDLPPELRQMMYDYIAVRSDAMKIDNFGVPLHPLLLVNKQVQMEAWEALCEGCPKLFELGDVESGKFNRALHLHNIVSFRRMVKARRTSAHVLDVGVGLRKWMPVMEVLQWNEFARKGPENVEQALLGLGYFADSTEGMAYDWIERLSQEQPGSYELSFVPMW